MKGPTSVENEYGKIGAILQISGGILVLILNGLRMAGHLTWADLIIFVLIFCLYFIFIVGGRRTHARIDALESQLAELRKDLKNSAAP